MEQKIIDAHMHLVQYAAGVGSEGELRWIGNGKAQYADGRIFQLLPACFSSGHVSPKDLLRSMDACRVEKGILLQGHYMGFQNIYSLDAQDTYPERFRAAISYDPWSREKNKIRDYLIEERGAGIVKFELSTGSGLMCNHPTFALDCEVMEKEYSYCDEHSIICALDIGKCDAESWQPEAVRRIAQRHPNLKLVVCHLLSPSKRKIRMTLQALSRLDLPNIWFDMAALPHNLAPDVYPYPATVDFLKQAIEIIGTEKLMYGSDFPSTLKGDSYEHLIRWVDEMNDLNENEKKNIFYETANKLYFQDPS